jgi:hypothetical protein
MSRQRKIPAAVIRYVAENLNTKRERIRARVILFLAYIISIIRPIKLHSSKHHNELFSVHADYVKAGRIFIANASLNDLQSSIERSRYQLHAVCEMISCRLKINVFERRRFFLRPHIAFISELSKNVSS